MKSGVRRTVPRVEKLRTIASLLVRWFETSPPSTPSRLRSSPQGPRTILAAVALWTLAFVSPTHPAPADNKAGNLPTAKEIIEKALKRSEWAKENGFEERLRSTHVSVKEDLNDDMEVKSTEQILYKMYAVAGEPFYERVRVNGEALDESERQAEERRRREFEQEVLEIKAGKKKKKDDNRVGFNRDLISRYQAEVLGIEEINGRAAYVLRFEPREGKLPVNRRIDMALNKSRGKLWIDTADYGVARVEFELMEPVRIWGGLLGNVSRVRGSLETARLHESFWFPERMNLYMKGRILFKSFHVRRKLYWQDFELPAELSANESAATAADSTASQTP